MGIDMTLPNSSFRVEGNVKAKPILCADATLFWGCDRRELERITATRSAKNC